MASKAIQQLVVERLSDSGAIAPPSSHPVTMRLDPDLVGQLDVLAKYLGYSGRSSLMRDLLQLSVEDLVIETRKALKDDSTVSADFRREIMQALEAR